MSFLVLRKLGEAARFLRWHHLRRFKGEDSGNNSFHPKNQSSSNLNLHSGKTNQYSQYSQMFAERFLPIKTVQTSGKEGGGCRLQQWIMGAATKNGKCCHLSFLNGRLLSPQGWCAWRPTSPTASSSPSPPPDSTLCTICGTRRRRPPDTPFLSSCLDAVRAGGREGGNEARQMWLAGVSSREFTGGAFLSLGHIFS